MADDVVKLRVQVETAQSIKELKELEKVLRKTFEGASNAASRAQIGPILGDVRNKISGMRQVAESTNSAMMRSYFRLGEELRRNKRDAMQLGSALGLDRGGLGSVFTAMMSPMGAVLGTATALGLAFNALKEEGTKARQVLLELNELRFDPNDPTSALKYYSTLREELGKLDRELAELKRKHVSGGLGPRGLFAALWNLTPWGASASEIGAKQAEIEKQRNKFPGKGGLITMDEVTTTGYRPGVDISGITAKDFYGPARPIGDITLGGGIDRGYADQYATTRRGPDVKGRDPEEEISFLGQQLRGLGALTQGTLTSAFVNAFGLANNLVGQLAANILATLGDTLFSSLISLIPGIGGGLGSIFQGAGGGGGILPTPALPIGGGSLGGGGGQAALIKEVRALRSDMAAGQWVDLRRAIVNTERRSKARVF